MQASATPASTARVPGWRCAARAAAAAAALLAAASAAAAARAAAATAAAAAAAPGTRASWRASCARRASSWEVRRCSLRCAASISLKGAPPMGTPPPSQLQSPWSPQARPAATSSSLSLSTLTLSAAAAEMLGWGCAFSALAGAGRHGGIGAGSSGWSKKCWSSASCLAVAAAAFRAAVAADEAAVAACLAARQYTGIAGRGALALGGAVPLATSGAAAGEGTPGAGAAAANSPCRQPQATPAAHCTREGARGAALPAAWLPAGAAAAPPLAAPGAARMVWGAAAAAAAGAPAAAGAYAGGVNGLGYTSRAINWACVTGAMDRQPAALLSPRQMPSAAALPARACVLGSVTTVSASSQPPLEVEAKE